MVQEDEIIRAYLQFVLFDNEGYKICRMDYEKLPVGVNRKDFIAKGNGIPDIKNCVIVLHGRWRIKGTDRYFEVKNTDIEQPTNEEGCISYLSSLRCGVGKKKAKALYDKYGDGLWDIIDNQPDLLVRDSLLTMKGAKRLAKALLETKIQSKVMQLFKGGTTITLRKANKLCEEFGAETLNVLRDHPYQALRVPGFSFNQIDTLALEQGVDPANLERREAAAVASLDSAASEGNVCLPRDQVIDKMMRLLRGNTSYEMCDAAITSAIADKMLANTAGYIYTIERYKEEKRTCHELVRLSRAERPPVDAQKANELIQKYEAENSIHLADSQKDAVFMCLKNPVCVITGGPGTGKSTVTKAVLYCLKEIVGDKGFDPVLLSPTGKAARRLEEATGYPASTIHSAIGLYGSDDEAQAEEDESMLVGKQFIIDESSMMDQYIAVNFLRKVPDGASVIFVGDPDQLPSVGCGNVLNELIRSQQIPTTKLSVIFRQKGDNPIVENAARVLEGRTDLLMYPQTNKFAFDELNDSQAILTRACNMYVQAVKKFGLDKVVLLCPYRKSGAVNVNVLNKNLQHLLNPPKSRNDLSMKGPSIFLQGAKPEPMVFRTGDKVMMTVNKEWAKNGDTGFIRNMRRVSDSDGTSTIVADVEFNDDGILHEIHQEDIYDLDLAYCTTVHKSQGMEYATVIMTMCNEHSAMLKRNLFYTGITRAKENVLLIGERSAMETAIHDTYTKPRYTLLADRLFAAMGPNIS